MGPLRIVEVLGEGDDRHDDERRGISSAKLFLFCRFTYLSKTTT